MPSCCEADVTHRPGGHTRRSQDRCWHSTAHPPLPSSTRSRVSVCGGSSRLVVAQGCESVCGLTPPQPRRRVRVGLIDVSGDGLLDDVTRRSMLFSELHTGHAL